MRDINEIIVHCTATRADWWEGKSTERKVNEVRKWHVEGNGWSDIGGVKNIGTAGVFWNKSSPALILALSARVVALQSLLNAKFNSLIITNFKM